MSAAFSSLHKNHSLRRTNSSVTGIAPRTVRVVVLGVGGVGKTGDKMFDFIYRAEVLTSYFSLYYFLVCYVA